jgi:hypothetical protein
MKKAAATIVAEFGGRGDDLAIVALAERATAGKGGAGADDLVVAAAAGLGSRDKRTRSGCVKLLYEIGFRRPEFVAGLAETFVALLGDPDNRMVWGAMSALQAIAASRPDFLFERRAAILEAVRRGSVITRDRGISALGMVAASKPSRRAALFPELLGLLEECRPGDLPKYAESLKPAVGRAEAGELRRVVERRLPELDPAPRKRAEKLLAGLAV